MWGTGNREGQDRDLPGAEEKGGEDLEQEEPKQHPPHQQWAGSHVGELGALCTLETDRVF